VTTAYLPDVGRATPGGKEHAAYTYTRTDVSHACSLPPRQATTVLPIRPFMPTAAAVAGVPPYLRVLPTQLPCSTFHLPMRPSPHGGVLPPATGGRIPRDV